MLKVQNGYTSTIYFSSYAKQYWPRKTVVVINVPRSQNFEWNTDYYVKRENA